MERSIFFVNDEPYCLWNPQLDSEAQSFLTSFDTEYFQYLLDTHLKADDEARAAISLRIAYHHGMETLFSLLGTLLQAPRAPQAWLAKCSNSQLRDVIRRISSNDNTLERGVTLSCISWQELAKASLNWYRAGTPRQKESIDLFGALWTRLSREYLDQDRIDEFNSIKHGFRVSSGGFGLRIGLEHEYGASPPDNEMTTIAHSEFGTSFRKVPPSSNKPKDRSLQVEHVSINWSIDNVIRSLQLVSISIGNVIGALRILNGDPSDKILFTRPEQDVAFTAPWKQQPTNSITMKTTSAADIPYLSKKDILNLIEK